MNGKNEIIIGIVLVVFSLILFYFSSEAYDDAYKNTGMTMLFGGYEDLQSQLNFLNFLRFGISPIIALVGIGIMISGGIHVNFSEMKIQNKDEDYSKDIDDTEHLPKKTILQKEINENKTKYCIECGKKINSSANYCPFCGKEVK